MQWIDDAPEMRPSKGHTPLSHCT
ncbi:hypothetical protein MPLB_140035 [Mesorhizobium sp. ORS 3324]|nr:hypothetical protein MPLB_140035 [Mesorhizobium sp. ORS 3324]